MYQKCVGSLEEGHSNPNLIRVFLKLGRAYRSIGAWDDAVASLEKGLSITESIEDARIGNQLKGLAKQSLGNTYLEECESVPERIDELVRKAIFWSEAAFNLQHDATDELLLDLAQEHYYLGDTEKAHNMIQKYLDGTVKLGPSQCQSCHQICAKDAIMEKWSVGKVARYCSEAGCATRSCPRC